MVFQSEGLQCLCVTMRRASTGAVKSLDAGNGLLSLPIRALFNGIFLQEKKPKVASKSLFIASEPDAIKLNQSARQRFFFFCILEANWKVKVMVCPWERATPTALRPRQSQFRFPANGTLHCYLTCINSGSILGERTQQLSRPPPHHLYGVLSVCCHCKQQLRLPV